MYIALQSAPVCHAMLTLVDIDTRETIILGDTDLMIVETNITFTTFLNRRYNVTVESHNNNDLAVSYTRICKWS